MQGTNREQISLLSADLLSKAEAYPSAEHTPSFTSTSSPSSSLSSSSSASSGFFLTLKDHKALLDLLTALVQTGAPLENEDKIQSAVKRLRQTASAHIQKESEEDDVTMEDEDQQLSQWGAIERAAGALLDAMAQSQHSTSPKKNRRAKHTESRRTRADETENLDDSEGEYGRDTSERAGFTLSQSIRTPTGTIVSNSDDTVQIYTFGPPLTTVCSHLRYSDYVITLFMTVPL